MKHFTLENRGEVERFEALLGEYSQARTQMALSHISLVKAWDQLHQREDGGRVFTALLDLSLTLHLIEFDISNIGGTWNGLFSKGKLEGGSILDSQRKFFGKMDIHRFATSFVLRYRAIWDKLMGFFILYFAPSEYDRFCKSDSKKKAFRNIASTISALPSEFVTTILNRIEEFDNNFRTAEAHGTGVVRKWALTMEGMEGNPFIELIGYWNILNAVCHVVGKLFEPTELQENVAAPPAH